MRIVAGQPVRPYREQWCNVGATFRQSVLAFGRDGVPTAPSSQRYRLDDLTNVRMITDWTTLTPAASQVLSISGATNQMTWPYRDTQLNQITVESTYNATGELPQFVTQETYLYTLVQIYQPGVNLPSS